jgi:hypothetical protein
MVPLRRIDSPNTSRITGAAGRDPRFAGRAIPQPAHSRPGQERRGGSHRTIRA